MRFQRTLVLFGILGVAGLPAAAMAQIQNSYKPMVTAPPGPQDPARSNFSSLGAPSITPPSISNGNQTVAPPAFNAAPTPTTAPPQTPAPSGTLSTVPGGVH